VDVFFTCKFCYLNNFHESILSPVSFDIRGKNNITVQSFDPGTWQFNSLTDFTNGGKALLINNIELNARKEMILIATGNHK